MKIKNTQRNRKTELLLSDYIENALSGYNSSEGSVEIAQRQADNISEAFARLCEILLENKILSLTEIKIIVNGKYNTDTLSIVEE